MKRDSITGMQSAIYDPDLDGVVETTKKIVSDSDDPSKEGEIKVVSGEVKVCITEAS